MNSDDKHLDGTGLGEVWAKIKSHVTSALQGWDGRNTTASGVHTSNITHVGTISYGTWQGSVIGASYLPVASGETGATAAGIVSTTSQSFAGQKTFKSRVNLDSASYANASLYTQNIYPQSTNTYEIGDDQHQFSSIRVNNFLTNGGNGFRFGANNGDIRFYGTKVIESFGPTTLVWTLGHNGGMTLHKGTITTYDNIYVNKADGNIMFTPTGSGESIAFGASSNGGYVWGYTITKAYMRFKDGKVGVLTSSPTCALDVYGDIKASGGISVGGIADLSASGSSGAFNLYHNASMDISTNVAGLAYRNTLDPNATGMFSNNNWASALITIRRHTSDGYTSQLGFSNTAMFFRYSLSGTWYTIQHSGNTGNASDIRLKSDVKPLTLKSAKDIVMGAKPVTFKWNERASELRDDLKGDDLGLIAQDVKSLIPSAVGKIFDEYEKLDYTKFIAPLIKVVQEQQREIEDLKKQIKSK